MPRAKASEPIDQSVPSVLDSAVELLAAPTTDTDDGFIAVDAPVPLVLHSRAASAIGSPIGRGSRSPSPTAGPGNRRSMLLNIPSPGPSATITLPMSAGRSQSPSATGSPIRRTLHALSPLPVPGATTEAHQPTHTTRVDGIPSSYPTSEYASAESSPTTTTMEIGPLSHNPGSPSANAHAPLTAAASTSSGSPRSINYGLSQPVTAFSLSHSASQSMSHPPSPNHAASKRLSFVSYNDLLSSTPISTLPLSSLTMPLTSEPPPHIPSVSLSFPESVPSAAGSASASILDGTFGMVMNMSPLYGSGSPEDMRRSRSKGGALVSDDSGGEWEREGFGRGLEERLEALVPVVPGRA